MRVGTAGWSVPKGEGGTQLQRYARLFNAVEINSSFYRPHRPQTYARWAASAPADFRFAVKAPRAITHEARLRGVGPALAAFAGEIVALGQALGPVLFQLPPSLTFDPAVAGAFLAQWRDLNAGDMALEPRHASWFTAEAEALLVERRVARVAADPAPCPEAAAPAGWPGLRYWRLHGSPRMYHTAYGEDRLRAWPLRADDWVILDNTASGAALKDAQIVRRLEAPA